MRPISLVRNWAARRLLCLGVALTIVSLGLYAWTEARPRSLAAVRPVQVAQSRDLDQHLPGKVHFDILAKLLDNDRRSAPPDKWLHELADFQASFRVETQSHPLVDHAAPDFTLDDHRGQPWTLHRQLNQGPVVLVFYLGYYCNACVHHLFELNADLDRFRSLGAEVVAISADASELTRVQFERYGAFSFPVLSDPDHAVARSFGVFQTATVTEPEALLHGTFLIVRNRRVHWSQCGDTPFRNSKALLYELARLEDKLPTSATPVLSAEEGMRKP